MCVTGIIRPSRAYFALALMDPFLRPVIDIRWRPSRRGYSSRGRRTSSRPWSRSRRAGRWWRPPKRSVRCEYDDMVCILTTKQSTT